MHAKRGFLLLSGLVLSLAAAWPAADAPESLDDAVQAVKGMIAQGRPRAGDLGTDYENMKMFISRNSQFRRCL